MVHSVGWSQAKLDAKSLSKFPFFFHWEGNRIIRVYKANKDPVWVVNMKVAIASLLQLQRDSGHRQEVSHVHCRAVHTLYISYYHYFHSPKRICPVKINSIINCYVCIWVLIVQCYLFISLLQ